MLALVYYVLRGAAHAAAAAAAAAKVVVNVTAPGGDVSPVLRMVLKIH
jgi:hypothetical protein